MIIPNLQYIVPILLETLTKQEEMDDEDEWNPCKAAGVCLMLLATCCEDDVVQYVLPFVKVRALTFFRRAFTYLAATLFVGSFGQCEFA